ncbi:MAG: polymer-forming cytoskeletal protein [Gammaproteobacteria bacterium]|nr:polymer-forming cytoskeletal protein [Gammaproteobacteria bacterium]
MFGGKNKAKMTKINTLIDQHTEINGDLVFCDGLHLDGIIRGEVSAIADSLATLTVGEMALIEGNVSVSYLLLNGTIIGDVRVADRVELTSTAVVTGSIYYKSIEMAMGAEVNGQLIHVREQADDSANTEAPPSNLDQNTKEC